MLVHVCSGIVLALVIAGLSLASGALSLSGAAAAITVGSLVFAAGSIEWSILLVLFFVSSSALARLPAQPSIALSRIVDRQGSRNWIQVFANGGVAALCAVGYLIHVHPAWIMAFSASLAAAAADTWATEIGSRSTSPPRSVIGRQRVTPGESGAVTELGIVASAVAAAVVALAADAILHVGLVNAGVIAVIGFSSSIFDSLLGATMQEQRFCTLCASRTEQRVHSVCGFNTMTINGSGPLTNDTVNAATSFAAGVCGLCANLLLTHT